MTKPYEWNGTDYQQYSRYQTEQGIELLGLLNIRNGERILDAGCGNGLLTVRIAKENPEGSVLGIDLSEGMLSKAEENKKKHDIANVVFQLKNTVSIDYENEFDALFSNSALHWIKDHKLLLNKFYKALKPGGRLVLGFASKGNVDSFLKVLEYVINNSKDFRYYFKDFEFPWYFPGKEYDRLIKNAGFQKCNITFKAVDFAVTEEELEGWFRTVGMPFWNFLPKPLSDRFFNTVISEYLKKMHGEEIVLTFKRLIVHAVKPVNFMQPA